MTKIPLKKNECNALIIQRMFEIPLETLKMTKIQLKKMTEMILKPRKKPKYPQNIKMTKIPPIN